MLAFILKMTIKKGARNGICWGELSGYKEMLRQRNAEIIVEYENGLAVDYLAEKYHLSEHTIRKILYQSRGS